MVTIWLPSAWGESSAPVSRIGRTGTKMLCSRTRARSGAADGGTEKVCGRGCEHMRVGRVAS
eukprot:148300-Pleurochrysis_carterae.AAC.1